MRASSLTCMLPPCAKAAPWSGSCILDLFGGIHSVPKPQGLIISSLKSPSSCLNVKVSVGGGQCLFSSRENFFLTDFFFFLFLVSYILQVSKGLKGCETSYSSFPWNGPVHILEFHIYGILVSLLKLQFLHFIYICILYI